jgi:hypothetical protein
MIDLPWNDINAVRRFVLLRNEHFPRHPSNLGIFTNRVGPQSGMFPHFFISCEVDYRTWAWRDIGCFRSTSAVQYSALGVRSERYI